MGGSGLLTRAHTGDPDSSEGAHKGTLDSTERAHRGDPGSSKGVAGSLWTPHKGSQGGSGLLTGAHKGDPGVGGQARASEIAAPPRPRPGAPTRPPLRQELHVARRQDPGQEHRVDRPSARSSTSRAATIPATNTKSICSLPQGALRHRWIWGRGSERTSPVSRCPESIDTSRPPTIASHRTNQARSGKVARLRPFRKRHVHQRLATSFFFTFVDCRSKVKAARAP
jgi:hypothetical protein